MSLNCVEIEKVVESLPQSGLIRKFFQIDKYTLIIQVFDGQNDLYIFVSIRDKYNRICLVPKQELINNKTMRFSQILNANFTGGRIKKIFQYNFSRVVIIEIMYNNIIKKIAFRLWGSGGNILLLEPDNTIIDCLRRFPKRGEWPTDVFEFPLDEKKASDDKFEIRKEFKTENINKAVYEYFNKIFIKKEYNKKHREMEILLQKEILSLNKILGEISYNISTDKEEKYKKYGELLKSNLYRIKKGDRDIELDDYDANQKIVIQLLSDLTPIENAENYFSKYKKIKNRRIKWEKERKKTIDKLEKLEYFLSLYKNINNINDLLSLEKGIKKELNIIRDTKQKEDKKLPGRHYILKGGYNAYVSRNAKEADAILKSVAKGNDYWFHVRDYHGSHVIVKQVKGSEIGELTKKEAATLAVYYSKARKAENADVYFTKVKYLHRSKGGASDLFFLHRKKI